MIRELKTETLCPNPVELRARLMSRIPVEGTEKYQAELQKAIRCRYAFKRVTVQKDADTLDLGFGRFQSKSLASRLAECDEAFVFAVTLGLEVDRLLMRLSACDPAGHFITDAYASALADAACELAEKELREGLDCIRRYSPGYGDLSLELQKPLLDFLEGRQLGLTVTKNLLMVPTKSITAIMGIKHEFTK